MPISLSTRNSSQRLARWKLALIAAVIFVLFYSSLHGLPLDHVHEHVHAGLRSWGLSSPTVEDLHLDALHSHARFLDRQSTTLDQATLSYVDRYSANPPSGFEYWFAAAQNHESPVIDDFDHLDANLAPFRDFFAQKRDLNMTDDEIHSLSPSRLLRMCIQNGKMSFQGYQEDWYVAALRNMVGDFVRHIPDVCVLVNTLDEPRSLLLPSGHPHESTMEAPCSPTMINSNDHADLWAEIHAPCNSKDTTHPHRRHSHATFAENIAESTDLCENIDSPYYGLIRSPESTSITHDAVPIVSNARLSTFSDILFPSLWRYSENSVYNSEDDMAWDNKTNDLYWRGSTTGGHASSSGNWSSLHRQHLVQRLMSLNDTTFDLAFTAVIQCDDDVCRDEELALPLDHRRPMSEAWSHRLLLDMDGNGLSGRYYGLLRSNSAVLRHSLMQEWADERLVPWVHYIPLTMDALELPDLVAYLRTPEGDGIARSVAERGKKWAERALRPIDQRLYLFRMLLEMTRDR